MAGSPSQNIGLPYANNNTKHDLTEQKRKKAQRLQEEQDRKIAQQYQEEDRELAHEFGLQRKRKEHERSPLISQPNASNLDRNINSATKTVPCGTNIYTNPNPREHRAHQGVDFERARSRQNDPQSHVIPPIRQRPRCKPIAFITLMCICLIIITVSVSGIITFLILKVTVTKTTITTTTTTTTRTTTTTTTTTTTKRPKFFCFPGESLVATANGIWVPLVDLKVGDDVMVTYTNENGKMQLRSSKLLALDIFQNYNSRAPVHYLEIYTTANTSALYITPSHSLLVKTKYQIYKKYQFAYQVNIGDSLYFARPNLNLLDEAIVIGINHVKRFDAYAPLTMEGNILVNHMVVSCYGTFSHSFVHFLQTPRRWWLYWHLDGTYLSFERQLLFLYNHVLFR